MSELKNIPMDELIHLLTRRITVGAGIDAYFAEEAARFLLKSKMVTAETMFKEKQGGECVILPAPPEGEV